MFKDILKYLPVTTVIIAYLFLCGGIFLVGFWGTFDVDAFSIIQVWDIPKNFIAPFMLSGGVALAITAVMVFFINKSALRIVNNNPATEKGTAYRRAAFIIIVVAASAL